MSTKVTPIVQALTASTNSGPAQRLEDDFYQTREQIPNSFQHYEWRPSTTPQSQAAASVQPAIDPKYICLLSWNIDVLIPCAEQRMSAALKYLGGLVSTLSTEIPTVIFFQEMCSSDIQQIKHTQWIQERFQITDLDHTKWMSPHYGNTALIDRRLIISQVFRVPWVSKFHRDGLFIDVTLSNSQSATDPGKVLRLCNTHLESLVADPPVRPRQLQAASTYLQQPEVTCALLAGDLNAIQPFDRTLHSDNELRDTYLELGGKEDQDEGYTWGQQAPKWMREKYGCSRMDKILFAGELQPRKFERIGMGVRVAEEHMGPYRQAGEDGWVTDHYGIMGHFEVLDGWSLACTRRSESIAKHGKLS